MCIPASCGLLPASLNPTTISTSLEVATWQRKFCHDGSRPTQLCFFSLGGRTRVAEQPVRADHHALADVANRGGRLTSLCLRAQVSHSVIAPGYLARTRHQLVFGRLCSQLFEVRWPPHQSAPSPSPSSPPAAHSRGRTSAAPACNEHRIGERRSVHIQRYVDCLTTA